MNKYRIKCKHCGYPFGVHGAIGERCVVKLNAHAGCHEFHPTQTYAPHWDTSETPANLPPTPVEPRTE